MERSFNQTLRAQQDEAFLESLRADQEKERQRRRESQRKEEEERHQRQLEEEERCRREVSVQFLFTSSKIMIFQGKFFSLFLC